MLAKCQVLNEPLKQQPSQMPPQSAQDFIQHIQDEHKRRDCQLMLRLMQQVTHKKPTMWGKNMVGFGSYHFQHANGREGDFFLTGFAPNPQCLTVYIIPGFDLYQGLLKKIGKYKAGNACLYIDRLDDVSLDPLACLIQLSVEKMQQMYPCQ